MFFLLFSFLGFYFSKIALVCSVVLVLFSKITLGAVRRNQRSDRREQAVCFSFFFFFFSFFSFFFLVSRCLIGVQRMHVACSR